MRILPDGTDIIFSGNVDEFGKPVQRTKFTHPYSYDGFVTWRKGENSEVDNTIYTDRLLQWDYEKYNLLSEKHFGNQSHYFNLRTAVQIEAFLRDWTVNPNLRLIFIMEYCNQASGYPVWRFDYADK